MGFGQVWVQRRAQEPSQRHTGLPGGVRPLYAIADIPWASVKVLRILVTLVVELKPIVAEEIVIVAVMHLHRRPGYWQDRV